MFTYEQSSGKFIDKDGAIIAIGYSGNGEYMNDPLAQTVRTHGPIPQGRYTICHAATHEHLGPIAMELMPFSSNKMFLRSGFFIHGDNSQMNHTGSDGCIIFNKVARTAIANAVFYGDNELAVIE
jgi:hypothetical protein